jgi:hypothetical protein
MRRATMSRTLGLYDFRYRLIKVHTILDHPRFPPYFLSYIVYHEMLHHVCPPKRGRRGERLVHHQAFKAREKLFSEYRLARKWEKQNIEEFLTKV